MHTTLERSLSVGFTDADSYVVAAILKITNLEAEMQEIRIPPVERRLNLKALWRKEKHRRYREYW